MRLYPRAHRRLVGLLLLLILVIGSGVAGTALARAEFGLGIPLLEGTLAKIRYSVVKPPAGLLWRLRRPRTLHWGDHR